MSLDRLHPGTRIVFLACFVLVSIIAMDPVFMAGMLLLAVLAWRAGGVQRDVFRWLMKPLAVLSLSMFVLGVMFPGHHQGGGQALATTGILAGLANALRAASLVLMITLVTSITPTLDILSAMADARLPPDLAVAVSMAFLYIPLAASQFKSILEWQKSRAARLDRGNPLKRAAACARILAASLRVALLRGRDIAWAIEARGFAERRNSRSHASRFTMDASGWGVMAGSLAVLAVVAYLRLGHGWFGYRFTFDLVSSAVAFR